MSIALDAQVAERVMGWKYVPASAGTLQPINRPYWIDLWLACFRGPDSPLRIDDAPPPYSSDIATAWLVVEEFRRGWNGHAAASVILHVTEEVGEPDCSCTIYGPDIAKVTELAQEMPLAICRAALAVVEAR